MRLENYNISSTTTSLQVQEQQNQESPALTPDQEAQHVGSSQDQGNNTPKQRNDAGSIYPSSHVQRDAERLRGNEKSRTSRKDSRQKSQVQDDQQLGTGFVPPILSEGRNEE